MSDWVPGVQPEGGGRPPNGKTCASPTPVAVEWRKAETLRLLVEGYSLKNIALVLQCNYATVMNYVREPVFREQLRSLRAQALVKIDEEIITSLRTKKELIDELGFKALKRMGQVLDDPNTHPAIIAKMGDSLLDRDPEVSRTRKLDVTERRFEMKGEDLLLALQGMKEIEERKQLLEAETEAQEAEAET